MHFIRKPQGLQRLLVVLRQVAAINLMLVAFGAWVFKVRPIQGAVFYRVFCIWCFSHFGFCFLGYAGCPIYTRHGLNQWSGEPSVSKF
jgi:hypothetical protein